MSTIKGIVQHSSYTIEYTLRIIIVCRQIKQYYNVQNEKLSNFKCWYKSIMYYYYSDNDK